jgi:hypothetical protein
VRKEEAFEPKPVHQLKFRAMFWEGLSIVFGTGMPATDGEISARLSSIAASWLGDRFGESWQVRLSAEPKTSELGDEIYASVLLATEDTWQGIRRIPGLPSVAAPLVNSVAATKIEEAVSLIQYAWGAGWPVRGTIALRMEYGTDHAWEFSVTYTLGRYEGEPTWEALWALMSTEMNQDGIVTPRYMSQKRDFVEAAVTGSHDALNPAGPRTPGLYGLRSLCDVEIERIPEFRHGGKGDCAEPLWNRDGGGANTEPKLVI